MLISRYRSPSPYINRFLSADTIVPGYANPQNLNRFSYVLNNPLRYVDPTGHMVDNGCSLECSSVSTSNYCATHPAACNQGIGGGGGNGGNSSGGGGGNGGPHSDENDSGLPTTTPDLIPDDTGPITNLILQLPGTAQDWNNVSIGFDVLAWFTDLYAAGAVTYAYFGGAALPAPLVAAGLPEVPLVTGFAGMAIAELYVQPVIFTGNILASISTSAAIVSDTKAGNTTIETLNFSPGVLNSMALTDIGWGSNEAYVSLILQSVAVSNDLGWTSLPFPALP